MSSIEQSVEVDVPLSTAYNQWTQFEEFPKFMDGVKEVRQIDQTHLHWVAEIGGHTLEWYAEITEQRPDERVAWKNVDGIQNSGVVTFHRLDDDHTRIMVQLEVGPEGLIEKLGDAVAAPDRRVAAALRAFKELVESRGAETGAWRGEVGRPGEG